MPKIECPVCKAAEWTITFSEEYQGEHPHGGFVTFVDDFYSDCNCELTDSQEQQLIDEAAKSRYDE